MNISPVRQRNYGGKAVLALIALAMCGVTIWLLSNDFQLAAATQRWAMVTGALGASDVLLENLSFLQPHFPLYVLVPFYFIPGLDTGAAPYLVALLAATFLLFMWDRHLKEVEISGFRHALLAILIVSHPAFLWAATSGGHLMLSMIAFYMLYRSAQHVITEHDIHSYISLAVVFLIFFFVDSSAIFIFVALLPLLVVIAPIRTVMVSPVGLYLIVGTPFAFAVGTWAYMNWIFEGDPLFFITNADSAFMGGMLHIQDFPWLQQYGGQFFMPLIAATGYMLVAYPVSVYLLLDTMDNSYRFRASFVLLLHPLIAIAIATSQYYLMHPFEILGLLSAGVMAELTFIKMQSRREFVLLVIFMFISSVGGWWLFSQAGNPEMKHWMQALQGDTHQDSSNDADLALGLWLKHNRQQTMLYDRDAYEVIAARGDAKGLVLSFSNEYKSNIRERIPNVAQIAVPDPTTVRGRRDKLNIRYPNLYDFGMKGFSIVYDHLGWRVYRKKHV
ncbi:hypothetical protein [Mariprofundus ferrooxydans]|uniref:Glycosyltransferase RgtA/B/C/D-like domain-containing protein n=1 Tax=Mariprofundus ferrooxydans PV-1 TaxID=314345 RepID=Q0EZ05_9PROT|nr:hypothetical protein [Mariprofundus ferrooxydans]EAU54619.1 hypothetical protein SPV1_07986 [Mariprofundus ferrooxydans PV-1]KON48775.1 hypothetical protein AL013_00020 [Mariprofundus ferrooxydans]